MAQIFISYKRVDKEKVLCVTNRIQKELNVSIWMDVDEIKSDAQFAAEIMDAIDKADVFLFMYSILHTKIDNYEKDWTIRELNYAQEQNKRIVFVNIDGTPLKKWFSFMFPQKQQVDARSLDEVNRLLHDISIWIGDKAILNPPFNESFEHQHDNHSLKTMTFTIWGVSFQMVKVGGGQFKMGDANTNLSTTQVFPTESLNAHCVEISKSYYIGETPVTQELWSVVMNGNPSRFINGPNPVDSVSWEDCQHFIERLNRMIGVNFRLPSEAEWEFAARGGVLSQNYRYSGGNMIEDVAWYLNNSNCQTHPVKQKKANELGIFDMSGNVWEWCQDYYDDYEIGHQILHNPTGPIQGTHRVYRGGCWCEKDDCRVTARRAGAPDFTSYGGLGLRLALSF